MSDIINLMTAALKRIPKVNRPTVRLNTAGILAKRIVSASLGREATLDDVVEFFADEANHTRDIVVDQTDDAPAVRVYRDGDFWTVAFYEPPPSVADGGGGGLDRMVERFLKEQQK